MSGLATWRGLSFDRDLRCAKICRRKRQRIGKVTGQRHFPSQQVNICGPWAPVPFVQEPDATSLELIPTVNQAFAEQPDGRITSGELVEELGSGHERIWKQFLPDSVARGRWLVARALVGCDKELATFGVEDGGDCLDVLSLFAYVVRCVGGDYVQCVYCDDLCGMGQVHCLCESYGYADAGEASWADRNVGMLDIHRLSAEPVQQAPDGRKELCAVSHRAGEGCVCEQISSACYGDRACSAGGFNRQYERLRWHTDFPGDFLAPEGCVRAVFHCPRKALRVPKVASPTNFLSFRAQTLHYVKLRLDIIGQMARDQFFACKKGQIFIN